MKIRPCPLAIVLVGTLAVPAAAQRADEHRTRIGLGAQIVPSFPGSNDIRVGPLVKVSRARGDEPFEFSAPDQTFGVPLVKVGRFSLGPALGYVGSRKASDVGAALPKIGFTVEAGAFAQYAASGHFRLRAEGRQGIGGHKGSIADLGADYVARDGDQWLVSLGPRVTLADGRYERAYFGVRAADSGPSGLPAYAPRGGIEAAGAAMTGLRQLTPEWGLYGYAKYARLLGDAADSPIIRRLGSRDQLSGGLALTYTFRGGL